MIKKQQSIPRICAVICLLLISVFSWNVFAAKNKDSRAKHFYKVVDNNTKSWFIFYLDNYALVDLGLLSDSAFSISEISQNEAAKVDQPVHRISIKKASQWSGAPSRIAANERIEFLFTQLDAINYLNRSRIYRQHFNTDYQRTNSRMISILLSSHIKTMSADSLLSVIEECMKNLMNERKLSDWSFQGVSANEHTGVNLRIRVTPIPGANVNEMEDYLTDNLNAQAGVEQPSDGMNDMLSDWEAEQQRGAASAGDLSQASVEATQEEADSEPAESEPAAALGNGQQSNAPLQDVLMENQLKVISNPPAENENMPFDRKFRLSLVFFFRFADYDIAERRIPDADVVERIRLFAAGIKHRYGSSHFTVTLSHIQPTREGIAVYYHLTQRLFSSQTHLDRINHVTLTRNIKRNRNHWGADAASPLYVAESLPAMPPAVIEQQASWHSRLAASIVCRRLCGRYRQRESLIDIDIELKPEVQRMVLETAF